MVSNKLAHLRKTSGHTQESFVREFVRVARRIGADATVSVRQLRRWESDSPQFPHPGQQAVLEAIFGIPLDEIGFSVPEHRRAAVLPLGEDGDVHRRRFVADLGGLTASVVAQSPAMTGGRIGTTEIRRLRSHVDDLYRLDHSNGGFTARAQARSLVRQIEDWLTNSPCTPRVSAGLQSILGEIHCHLGWIAHDAGRAEEARTATLEAMAAARTTGDAHLETRALSTLSLLSIDSERPWEATSAVSAARVLAARGAGPRVRMVLALREAKAAVACSDLALSRQALTQAIALHDRAAEEHDAPRWVRFAGTVEIDYATGDHYLRAGKHAAAIPFLRAAVSGLGAGYARNTALYRTRLAVVLVAAGEVEDACEEIAAVIDTAPRLSSARLATRLQTFARLAAGVDTAVARECVARLGDMGGSLD